MVTFRDITFLISDTSDVSEIMPFIVWAAFAKKGPPYNILGVFFLLSGTIKLFTLITAIYKIHNLPAYHFLAFLEIGFVYSYYQRLASKKISPAVILVLFVTYAANCFLQNINETFNSNTWTLTVVLIMVFGLKHFYGIYKKDDDFTPLLKRPEFVFTAGWLIYASGSLFTYLMGTDILSGTPDGFFKNAWIFQCISNIIKNALICTGFWLTRERCHKLHI